MSQTSLNGRPAVDGDLRVLALVNYGHFTTMQVRDQSHRTETQPGPADTRVGGNEGR